jgi:hypothetical protein
MRYRPVENRTDCAHTELFALHFAAMPHRTKAMGHRTPNVQAALLYVGRPGTQKGEVWRTNGSDKDP